MMLLAGASLGAAPAMAAGLPQTYVSHGGNDSNACTVAAPCLTFAGALGKTSVGGEIDCLDSGSFGVASITQSVTIQCDNVANAGVHATGSANIISINAGATGAVVLSCLTLDGGGVAANGIVVTGVGSLVVRNSVLRNFALGENAIYFSPASSAALSIDNVTITGTGLANNSIWGVWIYPSGSGTVTFTITHTQISGQYVGVEAQGDNMSGGKILGAIIDSNVSNNVNNGVWVYNAAGHASTVSVLADSATLIGNAGYGLFASGTAPAGFLVTNSSITGNVTGGISTSGSGVVYSYGNNRLNGNNGSFTGTIGVK